MDPKLLEKLSQITKEEEKLKNGEKLDISAYASDDSATVDSRKLLKYGNLITVRPNTRFTAFPKHKHNYIEMVYVCKGSQKHIIGNDTQIVLKEGELLLMNQYVFHETAYTGKDDIAINFIILPEFLDTALEMAGAKSLLGRFILSGLSSKNRAINYLHFDVSDNLPVKNLLENLIFSIVFEKRSKRIERITMGLLILSLMNSKELSVTEENASSAESIAIAAMREIDDNYKSASLGAVAKENNVSIAYVSKAVKATTGKTFKTLLCERRLDRAAELLISSDLTADEIIRYVGYENSSYFYRAFFKRFEMTPKAYREKG